MATTIKLCECGCGEYFETDQTPPRKFKDGKHREAWRRKQPKKTPVFLHQKKCGVKDRNRTGVFAGQISFFSKKTNHHG